MSARLTRRQLLAGSIGAAAAGLGASTAEGVALPAKVTDGDLLAGLVQTCWMLEYGCDQSLASNKLSPDTSALLTLVLAHQKPHLARLESQLRVLHLKPPPNKPQPPDVASLFSNITDEVVALQGMVQVSNLAQHNYWAAAGSFGDARLAQLASEILAVEAQHWTLMEILLHRGAISQAAPNPYTKGANSITPPHLATGSAK